MKKIIVTQILVFAAFLIMCGDSGKKNPQTNETGTNPGDDPGTDPAPLIQLETLDVSQGHIIPEFNPGIFSYKISVTAGTNRVTITALPVPGCTAETCGTVLDNETPSADVAISGPETVIAILVNNENGESVSYSLTVIKMTEKFPDNASFEVFDELNHPSGWKMSGSGELVSSPVFFNSGRYSAFFTSLTGSIGGREAVSTPVALEKGKAAIVSAWCFVKADENTQPGRVNASLKLYFYTDAGCTTPASTPYITMSKTSPQEQGVWEPITFHIRADQLPPDAAFACIGVRACYNRENGGVKTDSIFFDDISLQQ